MLCRPAHRAQRCALHLVAAGSLVVTTVCLGVGAAGAHDDPGTGREDAAAHAREDLAGESITRIERDTAAQARRLGLPRVPRRTTAATGVGVSDDPAVSGGWSTVVDTPVVPVFQAVLPSGKVLMWDSIGDDNGAGTDPDEVQSYTRAMVWDPTTDTARRVDVHDANVFCAGYTQLPNGDVLVVGGNKNLANDGIRATHVFHWRSETWTRGPDMAGERWYPSVAALGNGEAVIVGGGLATSEVYQADGTLRSLTGLVGYIGRLYPFLVPRGDGRVEFVGPAPFMYTMSTAGAGSLGAVTPTVPLGQQRDYGGFATYRPDHTLVAGGGRVPVPGGDDTAMKSTELVDTTGSRTSVTAGAPMGFARRQHGLTILADGSVLATGGMSTANPGQDRVDLAHPVLAAERWDPASNTWTTLASASRVRQYHSSAALLPDGRVLTGGGGVCGECVTAGYLEKNVEYYSPPYLFDARGRAAKRPGLLDVPGTVAVGQSFSVKWRGAGSPGSSIAKLGLIRLGAPTHSIDQGQRYVPLAFEASGKTLAVTGPASRNDAPPGYYLLSAVDDRGAPAVSAMVQVLPSADLALAGKARASTTASGREAAKRAADGRLGTGWASQARPGQWWQVDLRAAQPVGSAVLEWGEHAPTSFSVQVSQDGQSWTDAATGKGGALLSQRLDLPGVTARYLRVLDTGTGSTSEGLGLAEVQVFGP